MKTVSSRSSALRALLAAFCLSAAADPPRPGDPAPDLDAGGAWSNSAPLRLADLRGKVVLLEFWTSTCVNCLHVRADVDRLAAEFPEELAVVGVHTGKFPHETTDPAVARAVLRQRIAHPVVNDGERRLWKAYGIVGWPTFVVLDPEGRYVGALSGEGRYQELAALVRRTAGAAASLDRSTRAWTAAAAPAGPLLFPAKVAADAGRLFVADTGHHRVLVLSHDGHFLDAIGSGRAGADDGAFAAAAFRDPRGLWPAGDVLYIADTGNHMVRAADLRTRTVRTLAGTGLRMDWWGEGGPPLETPLASPWDLAAAGGRLYVAMAGAHQVWSMDLSGGRAAPYAGTGVEDFGDGRFDEAALAQPSGLATDGEALWIADAGGNAVRLLDPEERRVRTLVGGGLFAFGDADGPKGRARLQHPEGLHAAGGTLYVADTFNHRIRALPAVGGRLTTLAGSGRPGHEDGEAASFSEPAGVWASGDALFVADTGNHAVRRLELSSRRTTTLELRGVPDPGR